MKRFTRTFGIVLVAALTLASGIIHGRMSNRWGPSPDLLAAAKKLENLPRQFATWQLLSSGEMSDEVLKMLECTGYAVREYQDQETYERVTMTLLLGPSGPMSVHTPDICLPSRDYKALENPRRVPVSVGEGQSAEFWRQTFQANDLNAGQLRVYYAWSPDGHWSAPEEPRFKFADRPFLYKLQLVSGLPPGTETEATDTCQRFLEAFVPIAEDYLAQPSSS